MTARMSADELRGLGFDPETGKRAAQSRPREAAPPAKANKFGAIRTVAPASWGGERLADSKAGAQLARTLDTLKTVGSIVDWFEEVSLPIGVDEHGKVIRYRADAMVILGYVQAEDSPEPALVVRFIDRKRGGMDTRTSATKRAALRNRGLNVEVRR